MSRQLDRTIHGAWIAAFAVTGVLYVLNMFLGDLNQDEGWYLYAARLVARGEHPYIHFASTQGPVLPYVYGLLYRLMGGFGVLGGRLITAVLSLAVCLLGSMLARMMTADDPQGDDWYRHDDRAALAACLTFAFVGVNVYQVYFTAIVKTYALCAVLIVLGLVFVMRSACRRSLSAAFVAGVFHALATGTRTSALMVIAAVLLVQLFCVLRRRHATDGVPEPFAGGMAAYAAGAVAAGAVLYLPFLRLAPRALWFALVEYHAGRDVGGPLAMAAYKCGFISRLAQNYFVLLAVVLLLLSYFLVKRRSGDRAACRQVLGGWMDAVIWMSVVLVSVLHLSTPFPYEDYQVIVMPLAGIAAASMLTRLVAHEASGGQFDRWAGPVAVFMLLLNTAAAFSSSLNERWFVAERDRIWWPIKSETPLAKLHRAADWVRANRLPGDTLLTQDLYIAVEADCDVPRGLELGPFCYFPDWSVEKAAACRVVNREMMRGVIAASDAPVAAFSGYGFAIAAPAVRPLPDRESEMLWNDLLARYEPVDAIPSFGQAYTTLQLLKLRQTEEFLFHAQ